jgi:hypothetical protein
MISKLVHKYVGMSKIVHHINKKFSPRLCENILYYPMYRTWKSKIIKFNIAFERTSVYSNFKIPPSASGDLKTRYRPKLIRVS